MKKTLLALVSSFALSMSAYGSSSLSFSGGSGAPLTLTLDQSVSFTVTSSSSSEAPLFDFQGLGAIVSAPVADSSSTLTFSINNGAPIVIDELATDGGDLFAFNTSFPGITAGDTITLNAGSFTTATDYAAAATATADRIYTYITDSTGNQLSTAAVTAIASVPEPSSWAFGLIVMATLGVQRLRAVRVVKA